MLLAWTPQQNPEGTCDFAQVSRTGEDLIRRVSFPQEYSTHNLMRLTLRLSMRGDKEGQIPVYPEFKKAERPVQV